MRILFLHNNFPGQFHRLAVELAAHKDNEVVFLSHHCRKDVQTPDVKWYQVPLPPKEEAPNVARQKYLKLLSSGEYFANAMVELRNKGFTPDVVYGHVGFGCCLYAPDIFPHALHVGYFEWYYSLVDALFFADKGKLSVNTRAENRQSNLCVLSALTACQVGITPTHWQKSQHPKEFLDKIHVIHEGVDTDFFAPALSPLQGKGLVLPGLDLSSAKEIITYSTRSLDPYRGFPTFCRSLTAVLEQRPEAHVVIMGHEESQYGITHKNGKSWKENLWEEAGLGHERIHFVPFKPYPEYRKLLHASDVHVYLTAPFVLSWSMMEAMSAGCLLLASDTEPVREVITHEQNGILFPFWDHKSLSQKIIYALSHKEDMRPLRERARQHIVNNYALKSMLHKQVALLQAHHTLHKISQ